MIAAHRRAHRRIQPILWSLVVLLFIGALAVRRPEPRIEAWPAWLATPAEGAAIRTWTRASESAQDTRLLGSSEDAFGIWPARLAWWSDRRIEITPLRPLDRPELLVYWSPGEIEGETIRDDAHLIGRLTSSRPHRFALPELDAADATAAADAATEGVDSAGGQLVIYSLGHHEIVATARLGIAPPGAAR